MLHWDLYRNLSAPLLGGSGNVQVDYGTFWVYWEFATNPDGSISYAVQANPMLAPRVRTGKLVGVVPPKQPVTVGWLGPDGHCHLSRWHASRPGTTMLGEEALKNCAL
jgi:hypothetical protein